jgi:hypothetical protein
MPSLHGCPGGVMFPCDPRKWTVQIFAGLGLLHGLQNGMCFIPSVVDVHNPPKGSLPNQRA